MSSATMRAVPAHLLQRVDPELLGGLAGTLQSELPNGRLTVAQVRAVDARTATPEVLADTTVVRAPSTDGGVDLRVHPDERAGVAVLWIHGGGLILGSAAHDDGLCRRLAASVDATVVAVDYRLAPEHPYPAALDDCLTALEWTAARFARVVVAGASAGAGLAAAVGLRARDQDGPPITAQHLYYPMLDDRRGTRSAVELGSTPVWDRDLNELGWSSYLGGRAAGPYAAPARATDLSRLPPTYLDTGELDLFRDEDLDYAIRLLAADVPVELHLLPGAVHAFDQLAPDAEISRATRGRRLASLRRHLGGKP